MTDLLGFLHGVSPAWPLILGGIAALVIPNQGLRKAVMIAAPLIALACWFATREPGVYGVLDLGPVTLETFRFDALSRVWALVFVLIAFINGIYAFHERGPISDASSLIYAGSAVGAVFAGDLLTLFFFWEITAIASAPLIFAAGGPAARRAGLRYLAIQVLSGVLVLGGASLWASETGSWTFEALDLSGLAGWMLLLGFGIKACFPLLHMWMPDAYPKATAFGAVVLSAFTTKMAIYALARGFPGLDLLIYVGAVMAVFPIVFAILENDLRRTLAYGLINQLGFMVVGVGIGSQLALNGVAANAFVGVIYMALMFMVMGAVLKRTGTVKATELGGLFSAMPVTGVFAVLGGLAVVGAPLFSGFVAKTLILSSVHYEHITWLYVVLIFASAGVMEQSALKVPFFAFFGKTREWRVAEAPTGMLIAMGLCALLGVFFGVNYQALYALLPFEIDYKPYKLDSVIGQLQILASGALAFAALIWLKLYPLKDDRTILDADWLYRYVGDGAARWGAAMGRLLVGNLEALLGGGLKAFGGKLFNLFSPAGGLSRDFPSGLMALWTAIVLAGVVLVAYFSPL
ncbi:MAG: Na(+)/H(+) antiporter subunit D [Oceanicaulis sp.]